MKKLLALLFPSLLMVGLLVGCGDLSDDRQEDRTKTGEAKESREVEREEKEEKRESVSLPDFFPKDFPFPDNITVTEVKDRSDDDGWHVVVDFNFDPGLDMNAVTQMYEKYTNEIEYEILIGGEEFFGEGIYQFGAHAKMSASDMFVVTMTPEDGDYGSVDWRKNKD